MKNAKAIDNQIRKLHREMRKLSKEMSIVDSGSPYFATLNRRCAQVENKIQRLQAQLDVDDDW